MSGIICLEVCMVSTIEICGGKRLGGETAVQGSKNAVLPVLAATLLNQSESIIHNCPDLADVRTSFRIIEELGGRVYYSGHTAIVNTENVNVTKIPDSLMSSARSSVLFLGAMLSRLRYAEVTRPGGCAIGLRPIDLHIKAFRELGAEIDETGGKLYCSLENFKPGIIDLPFPSVGATENIMLISAVSRGETVITNAACEPEIICLQEFLNEMGADIRGAGSEKIYILGVEKLRKVEYTIISDRIFAATCAAAAACCGGDVLLKNTEPSHMRLMLSMLRDAGCRVNCTDDSVRIRACDRLRGLGKIITAPYPGFPTDAQAPFMSALCTADGTTVFVENIFESRYKHVSELVRMGADIIVDGRLAVITGCNYIQGARVCASDLRGGAALVVAGLSAIGDTVVEGAEHIDRGYEKIERVFECIGAAVKRV